MTNSRPNKLHESQDRHDSMRVFSAQAQALYTLTSLTGDIPVHPSHLLLFQQQQPHDDSTRNEPYTSDIQDRCRYAVIHAAQSQSLPNTHSLSLVFVRLLSRSIFLNPGPIWMAYIYECSAPHPHRARLATPTRPARPSKDQRA